MNTGSILIGLALLVATIPFVVSPFLRDERRKSRRLSTTKVDLEQRKTGALQALSDLDFDYRTGKVTQEDYESLRLQLVAEAGSLIETAIQERHKVEQQNLEPIVRHERDDIEKQIQSRREILRNDEHACALRQTNQKLRPVLPRLRDCREGLPTRQKSWVGRPILPRLWHKTLDKAEG
jgi:hypothetical protein